LKLTKRLMNVTFPANIAATVYDVLDNENKKVGEVVAHHSQLYGTTYYTCNTKDMTSARGETLIEFVTRVSKAYGAGFKVKKTDPVENDLPVIYVEK